MNAVMEWIGTALSAVSGFFYSYLLIILLLAGGIYFTVRTRFVQFRLLGEQFRAVTERPKDKGATSSFQALMISTASRVGTGNIVGVATAICSGGFGAVFWMWLIAILGSASAFVEGTLAQIYKRKGENGSYGGPAHYIGKVFRGRTLAVVFTVFLILTYGVGFNMLASYNMQSTFVTYSFYNKSITPWIIGGVFALLVGYCLFGGGRRLEKISSLLVPVMGILYIVIALVVVAINVTSLPSVFVRVFKEAFDVSAIFGGFAGSCVMYGIKRGLFSNEAGVGSAPNASASADVTHPVKQGLVQVLSVFIDTILVCSATAFMCMSSGIEPTAEMEGAAYVQAALSQSFGFFGEIFITVAMCLFGFTTLLGNLYYVDKGLCYLFRGEPKRWIKHVFYVVASLLVFVGAGLSAGMLWDLADILMGGMALINVPIIIVLGRYAFRALRDYEAQRKAGKDPTFHAKDIDLPCQVDYWGD